MTQSPVQLTIDELESLQVCIDTEETAIAEWIAEHGEGIYFTYERIRNLKAIHAKLQEAWEEAFYQGEEE